jgi:hypothetical protein
MLRALAATVVAAWATCTNRVAPASSPAKRRQQTKAPLALQRAGFFFALLNANACFPVERKVDSRFLSLQIFMLQIFMALEFSKVHPVPRISPLRAEFSRKGVSQKLPPIPASR